jgi:hypothetical protein
MGIRVGFEKVGNWLVQLRPRNFVSYFTVNSKKLV